MLQQGLLPTFECIVAHYNEDLTWLSELAPETIVYSKGGAPISSTWKDIRCLPNIGRETHTYLHHIVNHYDYLPDVTLFVQGNAYNEDARTPPHSTVTAPEMKRRAIESNTEGFVIYTPVVPEFTLWDGLPWETDSKFRWWFHKNGKTMLRAQLSPADFWTEYIGGEHPPVIYFASGAFFAVTSPTIRARPKSFYEKLLKLFTDLNHRNPEYGHYAERLWGSIFLDRNDESDEGNDSDGRSRTREALASRTIVLREFAKTLPPLPVSQEEFAKKREAWMKEEGASDI